MEKSAFDLRVYLTSDCEICLRRACNQQISSPGTDRVEDLVGIRGNGQLAFLLILQLTKGRKQECVFKECGSACEFRYCVLLFCGFSQAAASTAEYKQKMKITQCLCTIYELD